MTQLKARVIGSEQSIFYNLNGARALYGLSCPQIESMLSIAGGQRILRSGTCVATDNTLLKRAKLSVDAPSGVADIYVNNPWVFKVGDAIKVIGVPGDTSAAELAAITNATGASLGTITAIDAGVTRQVSRITPTGLVVGNTIAIDIEGAIVNYTVKSTVIADEIAAIVTMLKTAKNYIDANKYIRITPTATYILIESTIDFQLIEFTASIALGTAATVGTIATSTTAGIGKITVSTPPTTALVAGSKIGVLTQVPMGFLDKTIDLTNYVGTVPVESSAGVYNAGQLQIKQLPYLDGQILSKLPLIAWMAAPLV